MKYIIFGLAALFLLIAITSIPETPCGGGVYDNHPALVQECLHQRSINSSYPEPQGTIEPYPAPNSATAIPVVITVIPIGTRPPVPTEPPLFTETN